MTTIISSQQLKHKAKWTDVEKDDHDSSFTRTKTETKWTAIGEDDDHISSLTTTKTESKVDSR